MDSTRKYRLTAAALTLLLAIAAVATLLLVRLGYSASDLAKYPEADTTGILLAEEFVEFEMPPVIPTPGGGSQPDDGATPPPPDANDLRDAGPAAEETTPLVSSSQPSPVTEKPRVVEKPTGPSQEELDRRAEEKRKQDASAEAKNRMKFGKTPAAEGSGEGQTGKGAGSADSKGKHTGSGSGNVGGRGVSVAGNISCPTPGTVTVRITVTPEGKVTDAEIIQPTTISDQTVRAQCLTRARAAKVAPAPNKTAPETGRITFTFD